jgi:hypothetical protein
MFDLSAKQKHRRKLKTGAALEKQPRFDGAEAQLLLAELRHFKDTLGQAGIERVIGRAYDAAFMNECLGTYSVPNLLKQSGYPFDLRIGPTAELERALKALWDATPEKDYWRGRA